jgi:hypothetical protein
MATDVATGNPIQQEPIARFGKAGVGPGFRFAHPRFELMSKSSCPGKSAKRVFALDVPGIHVFLLLESKAWMAGT